MKTYFENLFGIIEAIILLAIFATPVVLPIILVVVFGLSKLWFLLLLLYLPIAALFMTVFDD